VKVFSVAARGSMETPNYEKIGIIGKLGRVDCSTMNQSTEIEVKNLDHLGLVAGIIDEIGIVEGTTKDTKIDISYVS
jgi:hypothetical protein